MFHNCFTPVANLHIWRANVRVAKCPVKVPLVPQQQCRRVLVRSTREISFVSPPPIHPHPHPPNPARSLTHYRALMLQLRYCLGTAVVQLCCIERAVSHTPSKQSYNIQIVVDSGRYMQCVQHLMNLRGFACTADFAQESKSATYRGQTRGQSSAASAVKAPYSTAQHNTRVAPKSCITIPLCRKPASWGMPY